MTLITGQTAKMPGVAAEKRHWSAYAKGTQKERGVRNKTEAEFEATYLQPLVYSGHILEIQYEVWSWRLTDKTPDGKPGIRYTADFVVMYKCGFLVAYEVKGTGVATTADLNRVKLAAQVIPMRFYVATKLKKSDGGGFKVEQY